MPERMRPQLGRLVVVPFATIGVLAAVLVWESEHVGSVWMAASIAVVGMTIGVVVAWRVRNRILELEDYYETLLRTADEQSRRAESANRLKDEFLATLSHELRTPMNSVLGWARLLSTGKLDPAQTLNAVQAIERASWAQSRIIEDLLDVSRIVTGRLRLLTRPTVIEDLVDQTVRSLGAAADAKRISIHLALERVGPVLVDPARIQQIVWNLVSNAVKFTPPNGHVTIGWRAEGDRLILTVSDTGVGFTPEVAAHLFERLRQGDSSSTRQFGGLGLGLGIVRHLVEMHGGAVTATSGGTNQGSVFTVDLPFHRANDGAGRAAASEDPPVLDGVSVLVVDDDLQTLEFVRATLEQYGAVVRTTSSANEARARIEHDPPDVLVSDLLMPEKDGLELIREIRSLDAAHGGRVPAVALTALTRTEDRRRVLSGGFQVHIAKPIDPLELAAAVERLSGVSSKGSDASDVPAGT